MNKSQETSLAEQLHSLEELDKSFAAKADEIAKARVGIAELKKAIAKNFPQNEKPSVAGVFIPYTRVTPVANGSSSLPESLQEAVLVAVESVYRSSGQGPTCREVTDYLERENFQSTAKDLYSSVAATLRRLSDKVKKITKAGTRYTPGAPGVNLSAVNGREKGGAA